MPELRVGFAALQRFRGIAGLAAIVAAAILVSPTAADGTNIFLDTGNLTDILRQMSVTGILALGMTLVILTAGIDLSVGSTLALATCLSAMVLTSRGGGGGASQAALAAGAALAASALVGAANGWAIAALRIQPFIVTLASMIGIRGLAKWLSRNENIDIGFGRDLASAFVEAVNRKTVIVGSFALLAAVYWVVLERTVFGRYIRAVGDNEKAALYTGLPVRSVKAAVYTLAGLLSGIAGVLYAAENHQGNPNAGVAYELDAIAAAVIGGASLSGGKGSIGGTLTGTLIMGVLTNMLRLKNVDSNVEMMLKAVIIVFAVGMQKDRRSE